LSHNYYQLANLAPVTAIGLFSGAVLKDKKWLALLVPIIGQLLADVYFQLFTATPGFYPGIEFNYLALAAAAGLGMLMKQPKQLSFIAYIFGGSTLFFIISNFGYFVGGYNGYSISGLTKTYIDAIPFFRNTIIGDMNCGLLLFGGYFLAEALFLRKSQKASA